MERIVKYRYIYATLAILILLQGCDMIRGGLGMPTSEDIALMKRELALKEQEQLLKQQRAEFVADSIKKAQQEQEKGEENKVEGYHVVIGSFKDHRNADQLAAFVKKQGYKPQLIPLKNGYMMVTLGSNGRLRDAVGQMESILSKEECPYDVWVYWAGKNLHVQN